MAAPGMMVAISLKPLKKANGLTANLCDIIGTGVSTRNTCNVAGVPDSIRPGPLIFGASANQKALMRF